MKNEDDEELVRHLRQDDVREIADRKGSEAWTTVYRSWREELENGGEFAAFAPSEYRQSALASGSWDLRIGGGLPGFTQFYEDGEPTAVYLRHGNDSGIEPIVITQSHYGIKQRQLPQISEEFRLYHNLWQSPDGRQLVLIDDDGSEEVVAVISEKEVRVRTPLLRQFQAARQLDLLLFIDSVRYAPGLEFGSDLESLNEEIENDDSRYFLAVGEPFSKDGPFSRLNGKKIIPPPAVEKAGVWPYEDESENYVDFMIGEDEFGAPTRHTCDPDKLANYFGANPDAPHYLTPVFFRREVLQRYYEEPEKYSVEDGYLRCGALWGVRMDNDHPEHVMVFLGDLGRDLPESHRDHWRAHNITPTGHMSRTVYRRSFLAEFADPEAPDLKFKSLYRRFNEAWEEERGWRLYKEPHKDDEHVIKRLRVPLNDTQPEFETQIAALSKVLVDFLNEKEIAKALGGSLDGEKGIAKLERWLKSESYAHVERDIKFLRRLQRLRSKGTAHRKASDYEKHLAQEGVDENKQAEIARQLWIASQMLTDLADHFSVSL